MKRNTDPSLWLHICPLTGSIWSYPSLMSNKINPVLFFSAWGKSCSLVWCHLWINQKWMFLVVAFKVKNVITSLYNNIKHKLRSLLLTLRSTYLLVFHSFHRLHQSKEFLQLMLPMASSGMRTFSLCSISIIVQFLPLHKNHGAT